MSEFFKFLFLMGSDIIVSLGASYLLFQNMADDAGTGTGAIGEAVIAWLIASISFIVMVILIGMGLYWLIFMYEISLWYIVISLIVIFGGLFLYYVKDDILDWLN